VDNPGTPSQFDPYVQTERSESKTVAALERLSEAFRVLLWRSAKQHTMSPLAVQILTFVRYHDTERCTVGYMAQEFNMTKQTVSDAVLTLERKGYIEKAAHGSDARRAVLQLTESGVRLAGEVGAFAEPIERAIAQLNGEQQNALLTGLLAIIRTLNADGVVNTQRMCFTCRFYAVNYEGNEQYCRLLNVPLVATALPVTNATPIRLDCPEHERLMTPGT
jgi:DNA-binding MarR family transcriptional regulator